MPFEEFAKKLTRPTAAAYVTIQKRGVIGLNRTAFKALGEPKAVTLLFDSEDQIVGFRAAALTNEHAYAVRTNTKGTSYLISGTLFTNYYGIPTEMARRWEARLVEGDILTIDLKEKPASGPST